MPTQLFDDRYAPITNEIGFLACDAKVAHDSFLDWERRVQLDRGVSVASRAVCGSFGEKVKSLLPLTSVEHRRFLFQPTRGRWTAYFDNGWRGTDSYPVISYLCEQIGCDGIRAVSVANERVKKVAAGWTGNYGATIFELYAPTREHCSFLNTRRSVYAANDGGRWSFDASGEPPLDFEDVRQYEARRIRDRFTPDMLADYLAHLGIQFFEAEFYEQSPAYLVYKEGPCAPGLREYSLAEARLG